MTLIFDGIGQQRWEYIEFGGKPDDWDRFGRPICRRLVNNGNQLCLSGFRPDTLVINNIGQGQHIDAQLKQIGAENYLTADGIIASHHERSSDELANRAPKDFNHDPLGKNSLFELAFLKADFAAGRI
jgi:hypothetical protein